MVQNSHCLSPTTVLNLIVIKPGKVQTILIFFGLLIRILVGYHVGIDYKRRKLSNRHQLIV